MDVSKVASSSPFHLGDAPRLNTQTLFIALTTALLLFVITTSLIMFDAKTRLKVAHEAMSSSLVTKQINFGVRHINGIAIKALLTHGAPSDEAWKSYDANQNMLRDSLSNAKKEMSFTAEEKSIIADITTQFQNYSDLIGKFRSSFHPNGAEGIAKETLDLISQASSLHNKSLATPADALKTANEKTLSENWANIHSAANRGTLIPLAALPAFILLIVIQIIVWRTSKPKVDIRVIVGLIMATTLLVATAFFGWEAVAISVHALQMNEKVIAIGNEAIANVSIIAGGVILVAWFLSFHAMKRWKSPK